MGEQSTKKDSTKDSIWTGIWGFLIIALVVILLWVANGVLMLWWFEHPDHAGPAGDLFGAATSLFSGLAFAGLISTLLMQRRELELQREQLELQNEELQLTRGELGATRSEFQIQRFESRFFGMIKLLNDHVESIVFKRTPLTEGRNSFAAFINTLRYGQAYQNRDDIEKIQAEYAKLYKKHEGDLGPYFRLLYNIFRQLDFEEFEYEEEKRYAAIVRAQLSSDEICLLMLNGVSKLGEPFEKFINKFALLEHLSENYKDIFQPAIDIYGPSAFGDRAHLFFEDIDEPQAQ